MRQKTVILWWVLLVILILVISVLVGTIMIRRGVDHYDDISDEETFRDLFHTLEYGSLKATYTFRTYEELFARFRDKNPVILEIGVRGGGGIELFHKYFRGRCKIYGVDIDPRVRRILNKYPEVTIFLGDQADRVFMKSVAEKIGRPIDIVLDDGGHFVHQQITSLEVLFPFMNKGSVYVIEDVNTSYQPAFNNHTTPTLVEYLKTMLDTVIHTHKDDGPWKQVKTIQFYQDIIAIHKDDFIPFGFVYKDKHRYLEPDAQNLPDPFEVEVVDQVRMS